MDVPASWSVAIPRHLRIKWGIPSIQGTYSVNSAVHSEAWRAAAHGDSFGSKTSSKNVVSAEAEGLPSLVAGG